MKQLTLIAPCTRPIHLLSCGQTDHRFPYVAGHRYEFRVVTTPGVELTVRGAGRHEAAAPEASREESEMPRAGLQVVFSVTSAYAEGARLRDADAERLSLPSFEAPASSQPTKAIPPPEKPPSVLDACRDIHHPSSPRESPAGRPPSASLASALLAPCLSPPNDTRDEERNAPLAHAARIPAGPPRSESRNPFDGVTAGARDPGVGAADGDNQEAPSGARYGHPWTAAIATTQLRPGFDMGGVDQQQHQPESRTVISQHQHRALGPSEAEKYFQAGGDRGQAQRSGDYNDGEARSTVVYDPYAPGDCQTAGGLHSVETEPIPQRERGELERVHAAVHVAGRLGWNPAWEQTLPSPAAPTSSQLSLPHIRRRIENSPRSAFGQMNTGGHRSRSPRERRANGSDSFTRSMPRERRHSDREREEAFRRRHGAEDTRFGYDDRSTRAQNGIPPYQSRGFDGDGGGAVYSPLQGSAGARGVRDKQGPWTQYPAHGGGHFSGRGGRSDGPYDPGRRGSEDGRHHRSEEDHRRGERRRRRAEDEEGWTTRGDRLDFRKDVHPRDAVAGSGRHWNGAQNGDPRLHRYHHRSTTSPPNGRRAERTPAPSTSRWEDTSGAHSVSGRAPGGAWGSGAARVESTSTGAVYVTKPSYSEALAAHRMKRGDGYRPQHGDELLRYRSESVKVSAVIAIKYSQSYAVVMPIASHGLVYQIHSLPNRRGRLTTNCGLYSGILPMYTCSARWAKHAIADQYLAFLPLRPHLQEA